MRALFFAVVVLALSLPVGAASVGAARGVPSASEKATQQIVLAQAQTYDKATLHSQIELSKFPARFKNLGVAACAFLTRKEVANWDVSGGECKFIKFLNTPRHGRFIPGDNPGQFMFQPTSLGKDVVRFVVENTVNGRQAVVSLHIIVIEPEA